MKDKILWIDNIKVLGLLGIMTSHFWPAQYVAQFHAGSLTVLKLPLENGFQGTFVFLIASGMGLTLLLNKRNPDLQTFLWGRFIRVYLPYWISLIVIFVLVRLGYNLYETGPKDRFALFSNMLLFRSTDVPIIQAHFWFIFVIVKLYLLFPLLFQLTKWSRHAGMLVVAAAFFYRAKLVALVPHFFDYGTVIWLFPFYLGIYLAFFLISDREGTERTLERLFPIGIILWVAGTIAYYQPRYMGISYPLVSVGLLISLYRIAKYDWRVSYVNRVSYETYLIHVSVLAVTNFYLSRYPVYFVYPVFILSSFLAGTLLGYLNRRVTVFASALWRGNNL